jgi:hypothetical protein
MHRPDFYWKLSETFDFLVKQLLHAAQKKPVFHANSLTESSGAERKKKLIIISNVDKRNYLSAEVECADMLPQLEVQ